jgi:hypothetical protein
MQVWPGHERVAALRPNWAKTTAFVSLQPNLVELAE